MTAPGRQRDAHVRARSKLLGRVAGRMLQLRLGVPASLTEGDAKGSPVVQHLAAQRLARYGWPTGWAERQAREAGSGAGAYRELPSRVVHAIATIEEST